MKSMKSGDVYYYITWTPEDDQLLREIMSSKIERRTTMTKLYIEAAERLNRTLPSVQGRWRKINKRSEG